MSHESEAFDCPSRELLSCWLDGERPAPAAWPRHAVACERCRALVSEARSVSRALAPLQRIEPTGGSLAALRGKLAERSAAGWRPPLRRSPVLSRLAGVAAAALGFLGTHVLLGDPARGPGTSTRNPAEDPIALFHALATGPGPLERLRGSPERHLLISLTPASSPSNGETR